MRQPKPYWKDSHSCWYFNRKNLDGSRQTVRLDPDKEKAWELYHQHMAGTLKVEPTSLVIELIIQFLEACKRDCAPRTHDWYYKHLESFSTFVGRLKICELQPDHVRAWIKKAYPNTTNGTTIHNAMRSIVRVCNWAAKEGKIEKSPLLMLKKPPATVRDVYLTPEQYTAFLKYVERDKPFRDVVVTLRETGCRPQELRLVEARHFDRANKCWVFPKEEAKGKRDERVIHLNEKALEITERLVKKNPNGSIFRNRLGNRWTTNALGWRCVRATKKLGFHVCPYAIRHTFATDAIIRGVDLITIAALMGHKTLHCLTRIYQHVNKRGDHLRNALQKATAGNTVEAPKTAS